MYHLATLFIAGLVIALIVTALIAFAPSPHGLEPKKEKPKP